MLRIFLYDWMLVWQGQEYVRGSVLMVVIIMSLSLSLNRPGVFLPGFPRAHSGARPAQRWRHFRWPSQRRASSVAAAAAGDCRWQKWQAGLKAGRRQKQRQSRPGKWLCSLVASLSDEATFPRQNKIRSNVAHPIWSYGAVSSKGARFAFFESFSHHKLLDGPD